MHFLNRPSTSALLACTVLAASASVHAQQAGGSSQVSDTNSGTTSAAPNEAPYGASSGGAAGATTGSPSATPSSTPYGADTATTPGMGAGMSTGMGTGMGTGTGSASESASTRDTTATTPMAFDAPAAGTSDRNAYSWLPYTTRGYVGFNGGQAKLDNLPCAPVYSCDDTNSSAFKVYTGGMFNDNFGMELAYFNTGNIDRSGGRVRAHGGNLSLVAQAPLGDMAAVYAKVGATYAWTKTSVGPLAVGIPSGEKSGAGAAYGVGLRVNATRNWALVLEWDQHDLKFAGDDKQATQMTTLGVQYRF